MYKIPGGKYFPILHFPDINRAGKNHTILVGFGICVAVQRQKGERQGTGMVEKWLKNKVVILLLILGAVYFFLMYLTPLVSPILTAMIFVTIFGPLLKKIQAKLHIHRQVGAVALLVVAGLFLGVLLWVLVSWIMSSLPQWVEGLGVLEEQLIILVDGGCDVLENLIGIDSGYLENMILEKIREGMTALGKQAVPGMLSQSLGYARVLAEVGGFLVTFIIATVLLAKDYDEIMNRLLDREECHVLLEVICGIIRYIATFVKAQIVIMSVIALLAAVTLGITGIRHGALWGILAGVLDALPFIGTGIVLVPLAVVQIFEGSYARAVACILLYVACIFLREILEPRLIGKRVGVPAIAVLLSLYVGIQLFGAWGIIKGPLGFILIYETYKSVWKRLE